MDIIELFSSDSLRVSIAGTIRAIVAIRVLNKTSEEYWFLMKFNLSELNGNMDVKSPGMVTEYFLVRLQIDARLIM